MNFINECQKVYTHHWIGYRFAVKALDGVDSVRSIRIRMRDASAFQHILISLRRFMLKFECTYFRLFLRSTDCIRGACSTFPI